MRLLDDTVGALDKLVAFPSLSSDSNLALNAYSAESAVLYVAQLIKLADELKSRAPEGARFDPPWFTLQIGRILGGIDRNVISGNCFNKWETRLVRASDGTFVEAAIDTDAKATLKPAIRAISLNACLDILARPEQTQMHPT